MTSSGDGTSRVAGGAVLEDQHIRLAEVDLSAARDALARIGAEGSKTLDALTAPESIALLAELTRIDGALEAIRARALIRLQEAVREDCAERGESPRRAVDIARTEASFALRSSRAVAGRSLATCRRLVLSLPGLLRSLAEGTLSPEAVHQVGVVLGPVEPEIRRQADEILTSRLEEHQDCGPREWSDLAEKVLHGLDTAAAPARHHRARRERHVRIRRAPHGMAKVSALIPAADGARIRKGLSVAAEAARASGDRRGHQQIMADLFADALVGRGDGVDPATLELGIIITDRSLLAPEHADAAILEGFGAVPLEHVREEMRRTARDAESADPELAHTLRRLYTDPEDGQLVAVESRSRAFPPALRRFLTYAHQSCRAPHCDADIRQMDHIVPWSEGGETSLANGNGLCAADNAKESAGVRARVIEDETSVRRGVRWISRYGQVAERGAVDLDPLGTYRNRVRREPADHERRWDEPAPHPQTDPGSQPLPTLQRALEALVIPLRDGTRSHPQGSRGSASRRVDLYYLRSEAA
ncbi:DUF222 domain-containing protein [Brachybacterium sp. J144]|uniref:HNH endonuclease signature motif containing protein n=1 Tax=Brachybacterium sp. J144 TaxID=3116487 RepID=UPI002E78EB9B|nr:DUF222 domain-containing protein [Brachybacterium sp. J144]MEE1649485.1 DUF222 domain-containing protein [Brachybacterium sp. J144]